MFCPLERPSDNSLAFYAHITMLDVVFVIHVWDRIEAPCAVLFHFLNYTTLFRQCNAADGAECLRCLVDIALYRAVLERNDRLRNVCLILEVNAHGRRAYRGEDVCIRDASDSERDDGGRRVDNIFFHNCVYHTTFNLFKQFLYEHRTFWSGW